MLAYLLRRLLLSVPLLFLVSILTFVVERWMVRRYIAPALAAAATSPQQPVGR